MSLNSPLPIPAPDNSKLDMSGLSEAQQAACYGALQAFLQRNQLTSWEVKVNLRDDGPRTWKLDISVVASPEFHFQVRSNQVSVDKTLDLAQVIDLCLETHYNACMNIAMSHHGAWAAQCHNVLV